mgnify:CR=1 FL=1
MSANVGRIESGSDGLKTCMQVQQEDELIAHLELLSLFPLEETFVNARPGPRQAIV